MRGTLRSLVVAGLAMATPAWPDVLLNNRAADPLVTSQGSPSTAIAFHSTAGPQLVTVWEQQNGSTREFNASVAAIPLGSGPVVDVDVPPAPAGYLWFGDPLVSAPDAGVVNDGTFYVFGQIRTTGSSPFTFGLGFLRGKAVPGPSITWGTPQVIETFGTYTVNQRYVGALSMDVHPGTQVVHIGYFNTNPGQNLFGSPKSLWHRTSLDGGLTWGSPMMVGNDSTLFSAPTIQCGPAAGDVVIYWEASITSLTARLYCRRSTDYGATLGPIETVRTFSCAFQTGPHGVFEMPFTLGTEFDRRGLAQKQLYVARGEEMDHVGIFMPDPSATSAMVETEPNGTPDQANVVPLADWVIRGTMAAGAVPDTDYYAFNMGINQPIEIWADSLNSTITSLTCTWIGLDGHSVMTRRSTGNTTTPLRMGFSSQSSGRYLLQVTRGPTGSGGYRIRTSQHTSTNGARDQRDMFISTATGSQPWSAPVNVSEYYAEQGYDESGVSLASNRDGYLYISFFDWTQQFENEVADRIMLRSSDGGASWGSPTIVSSAFSNWYTALGTTATTVTSGPWGDMATDGFDIHNVWVDVRNGDPDLYGVTIRRRLEITALDPASVTAHAGDPVQIGVSTHNLDDYFGWYLDIVPLPERAWPLSVAPNTLGPGMTMSLPFAFTIPDTAAPGNTHLTLQVRSSFPPYTVYSSMNLPITILPSAGVDEGTHELALLPVSPNPASASARLTFTLSRAGRARAVVFGIDGRRIRTLADEDLAAGRHVRLWDGRDDAGHLVGPGAYVVRLEAEGRTLHRSMVWLR